MQVIRRVLAVAVLGAVLVAGTSCSGSDSSSGTTTAPTQGWANGVCKSITTFTNQVGDIVDSLSSAQSKSDVQAAADQLGNAVNQLLDALTADSPPQSAAGKQAQSDLDALKSELKQQADAISSSVDKIDSLSSFADELPAIVDAFQQATTAVSGTVSSLEALDAGSEWKQSFQDAPACQSFDKGS